MQTETNQSGTTAETATPPQQNTAVSGNIAATAPGQLRVIKRNGTVVPFEDSKISVRPPPAASMKPWPS
jgi:ribonucleoside-diphosphate reductase alpha chain